MSWRWEALKKRTKQAAASGKAKDEPTERERATLAKHVARVTSEPTAPRVKISDTKGGQKFELQHPNLGVGFALFMEALGTGDIDFGTQLVHQLAAALLSGGNVDEDKLNFMLAVIKGIAPKDQLEAMLAAQMAAIHIATLKLARHLDQAEILPQQDSAEQALNKLARTFAIQMETLKRYRTGGEQKVTVQHVSVGEGGQAIVGNVTQTQPKDSSKKPAASPLAITDAKASPMPVIDEGKERISVPAQRKSRQK